MKADSQLESAFYFGLGAGSERFIFNICPKKSV